MSKLNVDPRPFTDSKVRSPPIATARFLLNVSPNPQPYLLSSRLSSILLKA